MSKYRIVEKPPYHGTVWFQVEQQVDGLWMVITSESTLEEAQAHLAYLATPSRVIEERDVE